MVRGPGSGVRGWGLDGKGSRISIDWAEHTDDRLLLRECMGLLFYYFIPKPFDTAAAAEILTWPAGFFLCCVGNPGGTRTGGGGNEDRRDGEKKRGKTTDGNPVGSDTTAATCAYRVGPW